MATNPPESVGDQEVLRVNLTLILPKATFDYLRPRAMRAGHIGSISSIVRWALHEYEKSLREQEESYG